MKSRLRRGRTSKEQKLNKMRCFQLLAIIMITISWSKAEISKIPKLMRHDYQPSNAFQGIMETKSLNEPLPKRSELVQSKKTEMSESNTTNGISHLLHPMYHIPENHCVNCESIVSACLGLMKSAKLYHSDDWYKIPDKHLHCWAADHSAFLDSVKSYNENGQKDPLTFVKGSKC